MISQLSASPSSSGDDPISDEFVKEILQSGVDLRSYSAEIESRLRDVENASVGDYIKESGNIASLHRQITDCDEILERLEGMLCTFQADLGNICQEILSLQEQSLSLNIRLKNKQALQNELSHYIEEIKVPEDVILHISDTPAGEKTFPR